MVRITLPLLLVCCFTYASLAETKYWTGTTGNYSDGSNWNTQSNGSGTSGAPTNADDIVIDRNASITIDGTYFPASIRIINAATVIFLNNSTSKTYTMGGSATVSPQFNIQSGAQLLLQGTGTIILEMAIGSTAEISGTLDITGSGSRMVYLGGITRVKNGGVIRYGTGSSNGTGSMSTFFMESGSTYEVYKNGGSFPTGTYDPNSLVLNTGATANMALFNMNSSTGNYGNYTFNSPGYTGTTAGFNQNITVNNFSLTDDGPGTWVFSTSPSTTYTFTVNGNLNSNSGTSIDINRAGSGSQPTILLIKGNAAVNGNITETGNNTGSLLELQGNSIAFIGFNSITNDVSLQINRTADVFSANLTLPNSPQAKLILTSGRLNVASSISKVTILNPAPDAVSGGSSSSYIIGPLVRATNQQTVYSFPVSENIQDYARLDITPSNTNLTNWEVVFARSNGLSGSGLTPGSIELVSNYYWTINRTGATPAQASNISLHYNGLQPSTVLIPAQVKLLQWNGTSWSSLGGQDNGGNVSNTLGSTNNPAPADPVTVFGTDRRFALGGVLGTLPISIEYLFGEKENKAHNLFWKVECTNTPGVTLTLERSYDGIAFNPIYTEYADAVRCQQPFSYTDHRPLPGKNFYRLKATDADGSSTWSRITLLNQATDQLTLSGIQPNPVAVGQKFQANLFSSQETTALVQIADALGKWVYSQKVLLKTGLNQIPIQLPVLIPGAYQLIIHNVAGEKQHAGFIIQ